MILHRLTSSYIYVGYMLISGVQHSSTAVLLTLALGPLGPRSRRSPMRPRQDGASSPRRLFFEEDSEGSVEEYHNWPEGSEMQLVGGVESGRR